MASDIWNISNKKKICEITTNIPLPLSVFLFETFASNLLQSKQCNHHETIRNKTVETFYERLNQMCKVFEIMNKKIFRNWQFSQKPLNTLLNLTRVTCISSVYLYFHNRELYLLHERAKTILLQSFINSF